jgi:hypothetical protein
VNLHQLIIPNKDCRRLGHPTKTRLKQPGPGTYEYCIVCTMGYEMAMAQLGDERWADEFVQSLRMESRFEFKR